MTTINFKFRPSGHSEDYTVLGVFNEAADAKTAASHLRKKARTLSEFKYAENRYIEAKNRRLVVHGYFSDDQYVAKRLMLGQAGLLKAYELGRQGVLITIPILEKARSTRLTRRVVALLLPHDQAEAYARLVQKRPDTEEKVKLENPAVIVYLGNWLGNQWKNGGYTKNWRVMDVEIEREWGWNVSRVPEGPLRLFRPKKIFPKIEPKRTRRR